MTVASRVLIKITARFGSSGGYLFLFTMLMMRAIKAMIKLQNMHDIVSKRQIDALGYMLRRLEIGNKDAVIDLDARMDEFYVEFSIATLDNGKKVAYAKKFAGYDADFTKKYRPLKVGVENLHSIRSLYRRIVYHKTAQMSIGFRKISTPKAEKSRRSSRNTSRTRLSVTKAAILRSCITVHRMAVIPFSIRRNRAGRTRYSIFILLHDHRALPRPAEEMRA